METLEFCNFVSKFFIFLNFCLNVNLFAEKSIKSLVKREAVFFFN